MCQSKLTEFLRELTEFAAELSEFSLPNSALETVFPPFRISAAVQNLYIHLDGCNPPQKLRKIIQPESVCHSHPKTPFLRSALQNYPPGFRWFGNCSDTALVVSLVHRARYTTDKCKDCSLYRNQSGVDLSFFPCFVCSIRGHRSQVLVFTSIWGTQKKIMTMTLFALFFQAFRVFLGPQTLQKKGACFNPHTLTILRS